MFAGRVTVIVGTRSSIVIVVVTESFRLPEVSFALNLRMQGPFVAVQPMADGVEFVWKRFEPNADIVMFVTLPTWTVSTVPASVTEMFIRIGLIERPVVEFRVEFTTAGAVVSTLKYLVETFSLV